MCLILSALSRLEKDFGLDLEMYLNAGSCILGGDRRQRYLEADKWAVKCSSTGKRDSNGGN